MSPAEPFKRCLSCDYILDGLPEPRCPECGRPFDPNDCSTYAMQGHPSVKSSVTSYLIAASSLGIFILLPPILVSTTSLQWGDTFTSFILMSLLAHMAELIIFILAVVRALSTYRVRRFSFTLLLVLVISFLMAPPGCILWWSPFHFAIRSPIMD